MVSIQLEGNKSGLDSGRAASAGKEMLKQLARTDPYYKRNRPHVCSFFLKGECNRGAECPYRYDLLLSLPPQSCTEQRPFPRHEKPVENALSHQNMQDRYYGRNDPVAHKIMATHAETQGLAPPSDPAIVSRNQPPISAFNPTFPLLDVPIPLLTSYIRYGTQYPHSGHPVITFHPIIPNQVHCPCRKDKVCPPFFLYFIQPPTVSRCAFVNFKDRDTAEQAAQAWANGLDLEGVRVAVKWGRSKSTQGAAPKPPPAVEPSVDS